MPCIVLVYGEQYWKRVVHLRPYKPLVSRMSRKVNYLIKVTVSGYTVIFVIKVSVDNLEYSSNNSTCSKS